MIHLSLNKLKKLRTKVYLFIDKQNEENWKNYLSGVCHLIVYLKCKYIIFEGKYIA